MNTKSSNLLENARFEPEYLCYNINSEGDFHWTYDDFLILRLTVKSTKRVPLKVTFNCGGEKRSDVNYNIVPNSLVTAAIPLSVVRGQNWYLYPYPGCLKATASGKPENIDNIDKIVIWFSKLNNGAEPMIADDIDIKEMYIGSLPAEMSVVGKPICDKYGQRIDADWDGKIKSNTQLCSVLKTEYLESLSSEKSVCMDRDRFGGWTGKTFKKKGYFYETHDEKRSWLCDPDGNAFLAIGFGYGSAARMGSACMISGNECLYDNLPEKNSEFKQAYTSPLNNAEFVKRYGKSQSVDRVMFNFGKANMIRVFGADRWLDAYCTILRGRMKRWGMNSLAIGIDDSSEEPAHIYAKRLGMPFIFRMPEFPTAKKRIFRDFSDVFSKEFEDGAKKFAQSLVPFLDDENFMGFYMNNEPFFMTAPYSVTEAALNDVEGSETRRYIVSELEKQYGGIDALNSAWGTSFVSLEEIRTDCIEKGEATEADIKRFDKLLTERFWSIPAHECERVTNGRCINFGFRPAGSWTRNYDYGMDSTDVFSLNCYKTTPTMELANIAKQHPSKSVLLSEWHIGDAGVRMFQNGITASIDEKTRAKACRRYFEDGFAASNCVGVHYFEYCDMPLLGRFDGACAAIGLVSEAGTEHKAITAEVTKACRNAYSIASGTTTPFEFPDDWIHYVG